MRERDDRRSLLSRSFVRSEDAFELADSSLKRTVLPKRIRRKTDLRNTDEPSLNRYDDISLFDVVDEPKWQRISLFVANALESNGRQVMREANIDER